MGINDVMVTCFRNQYKQRHNTLKKALVEVEDTYGLNVKNLHVKTAINKKDIYTHSPFLKAIKAVKRRASLVR